MNILVYLIPLALMLGLGGLAVFLWALRSGQFEDLDGASVRILDSDHDEKPIDRKKVRPKKKRQTKHAARRKSNRSE